MTFSTIWGVHVLGGIIVQYLMSILLNIRQIYSRLQFFFFFWVMCNIITAYLLKLQKKKKKNEGKNMCYHVIHVIFFIFIFLYKRMRLMWLDEIMNIYIYIFFFLGDEIMKAKLKHNIKLRR